MAKYTIVRIKSGDGWHDSKGEIKNFEFENQKDAMRFMIDDSEDMTAKWPELNERRFQFAVKPCLIFATKDWKFGLTYCFLTEEDEVKSEEVLHTQV